MAKLPKQPKPEMSAPIDLRGMGKTKYGIGPVTEKLIGRFVVAWSRAEAVLGDLAWTILDVSEEDGRVVTSRVDASTRIDIVKAFAERYLQGDDLEVVAKILHQAELCRDARNLIVHGSWGTLGGTSTPIVMTLKKSQPDAVYTETFPNERLRSLIHNANVIRNAVAEWRKKFEEQPGRRTPPLYTRPTVKPEEAKTTY